VATRWDRWYGAGKQLVMMKSDHCSPASEGFPRLGQAITVPEPFFPFQEHTDEEFVS
jgi:hypothetical protein